MKKLLLIALLSLPLFAGNMEVQEGFVAAHTQMPLDSTIDPFNNTLHGDLNMQGNDLTSIKGKLWVEMNLFFSDEADRDVHMNETDEANSFPLATYEIVSISKNDKASDYTLHGNLNFHGQKRAFSATADITQDQDNVTIKATSHFLMSEYGVEVPCMMFMCVRDQIDIFAKAVLHKSSSQHLAFNTSGTK